MAAEEGSEGSVANSSSTSNIWELHGHSLSSWNHNNSLPSWNNPPNPNSNSSCDEDISISNSFTNTSNHSGLSTDDSSRQAREPASDNHLWSKVLLSIGNGGSHNNQDVGENFLDALSSKNLTTDLFEPVCDYLKKMDNSWGFSNSTAYNNIERQLNSFNGSLLQQERVNNLPNLVTDWSIAPPCPEVDLQITHPPPRNLSIDSMDQYSDSDMSQMKHSMSSSSVYGAAVNSGIIPCYGHDMKVDNQHQQLEPSEALFHRSYKNNMSTKYQVSHNSSPMGESGKYYYGMSEAPWMNTKNLSDVISFNGCVNKVIVDPQSSRPCLKSSNQPESKRQNEISAPPARGCGRGNRSVIPEGKKKRSEDSSFTQFKKPKQETSTGSSVKVQGPKVKLGERITALQQIVSPFGKTDTASVLQEAIGYIKFLQEQVQVLLLSNPYMKSNANKDPWGMLERKEKADAKFDLKSRGLCLVPISCTPQVYRENTGSDYWTPTYRGCLYR